MRKDAARRASLGPVAGDGTLQAHPSTYSLSGNCNLLAGSLSVASADLRIPRVCPRLRSVPRGCCSVHASSHPGDTACLAAHAVFTSNFRLGYMFARHMTP